MDFVFDEVGGIDVDWDTLLLLLRYFGGKEDDREMESLWLDEGGEG